MISLGVLFDCPSIAAELTEPAPAQSLGLTVQNGRLLRYGKPYYGIGVNYFDLFERVLKNPADDSHSTGLKKLANAKIPFARFMAGGFWPIDWELYLHDKDAYFNRLDKVVHSAESEKVALIPSLFWNMSTVPDIVGEPLDQWGNPESRTTAFMREYTKEVVLRYRDSPAIWGWEFGNEYNLAVDLPNASQHRPPIVPSLKTAASRSARDELSSKAMLVAFRQFADNVRKYDGHRIVITGNSLPRASAYHNTKWKSWEKDSSEQFREILLRDNPDPMDMISVHLYANEGQGGATSILELVTLLQHVSTAAKRPLFIGEFGVRNSHGKTDDVAAFAELLSAVESEQVPLAAVWVYDYTAQNEDWNIAFNNERSYALTMISNSNERRVREADDRP